MDITLLILFPIVVVAFILQWRANAKLKKQNTLIVVQSNEIQKQMRELQEQSKQLEELFQERHQMLSVVSHDLKGPFNRVFALIQLMNLSQENLSEEQKDYLGKIHQIVVDGLGMIRNLLDNRRLEAKGIDLVPERLNMSAIVGSLVKNSKALAQKKKINLVFEAPPQVWVMTDKLYVNRVFENLISNAMKFSPADKSVFVKVTELENEVEVSVRDEGPGISAEDQTKLYQKFQQLTARPTGGESSTGLGLSIVKSFLDKLEGTIQCTSEIDRGAMFSVRLKKIS
jgi:Signal transduction histidine kinase